MFWTILRACRRCPRPRSHSWARGVVRHLSVDSSSVRPATLADGGSGKGRTSGAIATNDVGEHRRVHRVPPDDAGEPFDILWNERDTEKVLRHGGVTAETYRRETPSYWIAVDFRRSCGALVGPASSIEFGPAALSATPGSKACTQQLMCEELHGRGAMLDPPPSGNASTAPPERQSPPGCSVVVSARPAEPC